MSDSWDQKIYQDRQLDGQIAIICAPEVLQCFLYHLPTQVLAAISQYLACFYQPFRYLFKGMLCFETCSRTENPDKKGRVWKLLTQFFRPGLANCSQCSRSCCSLMFIWHRNYVSMGFWGFFFFFNVFGGLWKLTGNMAYLGWNFITYRSKGNGYLHKLES